MNENQNYLRRIDGELNSLKSWNPSCWRIEHLEKTVRPDVVSRMSEKELYDYANSGMSARELAAKEEEDLARMESNRDSVSI